MRVKMHVPRVPTIIVKSLNNVRVLLSSITDLNPNLNELGEISSGGLS